MHALFWDKWICIETEYKSRISLNVRFEIPCKKFSLNWVGMQQTSLRLHTNCTTSFLWWLFFFKYMVTQFWNTDFQTLIIFLWKNACFGGGSITNFIKFQNSMRIRFFVFSLNFLDCSCSKNKLNCWEISVCQSYTILLCFSNSCRIV